MATLRDRIAALQKSFTPAELKLSEVLLNHPEPFLLSIGELAERAQVSDATAVRFYRRLGYSSYQELKVNLAQEATGTSSQAVYEEVEPTDTPDQVLEKVIHQSVSALRTTLAVVDKQALNSAAHWIAAAERLFFIGVGASAAIASDAAHKFLRLGGTSQALGDPHLMCIAASHMRPGDVVIAISHSGESSEVLDAVRLANGHAHTVAITGYANSSLATLAEAALVTAAHEARYRSDAMASRLVQLALIDALYVATVCMWGQTAVDAVNRSRLAVARRKT